MKKLESLQQVNEASKISVKEMLEDIEAVHDAYDNATKKAITDKYGINSKKMAEIEHGILIKAAEDRATRTKFDENDITAFRKLTNMPEIYHKFEEYLMAEPEAFIIYMKDFYENQLKQDNLLQYATWKISDLKYRRIPYSKIYTIKFYQFFVKYLDENGSSNKSTRDAREEAITLVLGKLTEQLKDFKEKLLNNAEEQGKNHYKNIQENLDSWKKKANSFEKQRQEFINNWTKERKQGWYWRDPDYLNLEKAEKVWRAKYANGKYILKQWTLEEYAKYCKEEADREYERKKRTMAEKIVDRDFDYSKLEFTNVKQDPKWIEMMITDGEKKVYARSIIAAEFSEKVTVHFRFILTDRK